VKRVLEILEFLKELKLRVFFTFEAFLLNISHFLVSGLILASEGFDLPSFAIFVCDRLLSYGLVSGRLVHEGDKAIFCLWTVPELFGHSPVASLLRMPHVRLLDLPEGLAHEVS
jgi:hypothetical protein